MTYRKQNADRMKCRKFKLVTSSGSKSVAFLFRFTILYHKFPHIYGQVMSHNCSGHQSLLLNCHSSARPIQYIISIRLFIYFPTYQDKTISRRTSNDFNSSNRCFRVMPLFLRYINRTNILLVSQITSFHILLQILISCKNRNTYVVQTEEDTGSISKYSSDKLLRIRCA